MKIKCISYPFHVSYRLIFILTVTVVSLCRREELKENVLMTVVNVDSRCVMCGKQKRGMVLACLDKQSLCMSESISVTSFVTTVGLFTLSTMEQS
jgi:hypothetical protein